MVGVARCAAEPEHQETARWTYACSLDWNHADGCHPDAGAAPANAPASCWPMATPKCAWGQYREMTFPWDHLVTTTASAASWRTTSLNNWLKGWNVRRVDLEQLNGPLRLDGVDGHRAGVRQCVCDRTRPPGRVRARGGGLLVTLASGASAVAPTTTACCRRSAATSTRRSASCRSPSLAPRSGIAARSPRRCADRSSPTRLSAGASTRPTGSVRPATASRAAGAAVDGRPLIARRGGAGGWSSTPATTWPGCALASPATKPARAPSGAG